MEDNALGYSGSNSGGSLVIEDSLFRRNSSGVVPNSENPGDRPPPQDGECNRPETPSTPTPTITTTDIARCTIIRNDVIVENNNLEAPGLGTAAELWGIGVILPGDTADLVEKNIIADNPIDGVLGLEYPNPFPPTTKKKKKKKAMERSSSRSPGTGSAATCSSTTATTPPTAAAPTPAT